MKMRTSVCGYLGDVSDAKCWLDCCILIKSCMFHIKRAKYFLCNFSSKSPSFHPFLSFYVIMNAPIVADDHVWFLSDLLLGQRIITKICLLAFIWSCSSYFALAFKMTCRSSILIVDAVINEPFGD